MNATRMLIPRLRGRVGRWVIGAALMLTLCGCASLGRNVDPPTVRLISLQPLAGTGFSQTFKLRLDVQNANAEAIEVRGLSYSVALNDIELLSGVSGKVPVLAPYSVTPLELEATAGMIGAVKFFTEWLDNKVGQTVSYSLDARFDIKGLARRLSVRETGTVPLLSRQLD